MLSADGQYWSTKAKCPICHHYWLHTDLGGHQTQSPKVTVHHLISTEQCLFKLLLKLPWQSQKTTVTYTDHLQTFYNTKIWYAPAKWTTQHYGHEFTATKQQVKQCVHLPVIVHCKPQRHLQQKCICMFATVSSHW